jgi:putative tricarboxylic transport membrane protein
VGAFRVGIGSLIAPGPGFMPFGAASLLILFSFGAVAESLFGARKDPALGQSQGKRWGVAALVLFMLFIYALLLDILGFLLATFLLLTGLFRLSEGQTWKVALAESLTTTLLTYLLFDYALKCSFPKGLLEWTGF